MPGTAPDTSGLHVRPYGLGGWRGLFASKSGRGHESAATGFVRPVSLQKQEQIKGPKNGSTARFDGLCCYQSRSGFQALSA